MSESNDNVVGLDSLTKALRLGEVTKEDAERRFVEARDQRDRIERYVQVLQLVQQGAASMHVRGLTRGFFIRSYMRRLDAPSLAFEFQEFHIPAFSTDTAAVARLPEALRGKEEDAMRVPCPSPSCKNERAYVVGVLSPNRGGYHRAPAAVSFFSVCPHCVSASILTSGLPVEALDAAPAQTA